MVAALQAQAGTDRGRDRLALAVVCSFFPSRIQPWLVTAIEQAMLRGAEPVIYAFRSAWEDPPEKVAKLDLLRRTCYVRPGSLLGIGRALASAFWPPARFSADSRRGLAQLMFGRRFSLASPALAASALALAPAVGRRPLHLVHAHSMVPAYYFTSIAAGLRVPFLLTFHGLPPEGVPTLPPERARLLFETVSRVQVNTRFAADQVEALGCPPARIKVIPQGLVLEEFPFKPRPYIRGEPVNLLTVGRLQPDKGHRYALEAVARLVERGFDVRYRIVGLGSGRDALVAQCRSLGLDARVTFLSGLSEDELRMEYARAHLFLLPSLRDRVGRHEETQGVVIQEAQASGCIVVATRSGGIPECVEEGRSAFLVPDRDAEALAAAVENVLRAPGQWPEWQQAGRRWVEERFDAAVIGARQWDIYQELLAERQPAGAATG